VFGIVEISVLLYEHCSILFSMIFEISFDISTEIRCSGNEIR